LASGSSVSPAGGSVQRLLRLAGSAKQGHPAGGTGEPLAKKISGIIKPQTERNITHMRPPADS